MANSSYEEISAYVQKIVTYSKELITNIFITEFEKCTLRSYDKAMDVYFNKNSKYGYNGDIDFKHYALTLKKGINHISFLNDQEDKKTFKKFLELSLNTRNEVWHNQIKNDKLYYMNFGLSFKKVLTIINTNQVSDSSNIIDKRYMSFIDKFIHFMCEPSTHSFISEEGTTMFNDENDKSNDNKETEKENNEPHSPTDSEIEEYFA